MNPWEQYAAPAPAAGPWTKYAQPPAASPAPASHSMSDIAAEVKRQLGLTLRYGIEGAGQVATIPGDAINAVLNIGSGAINKVAGTNIPRLDYPSVRLDQSLTNAGLPEPQGTAEKIVGALSTGVASGAGITGAAKALAGAGVKGAEALTGALPKLGGTSAGAAPATAEIKSMSQAAYKQAEDAGAIIKPQAIQAVEQDFKTYLADKAYEPALQTKIPILLDRLQKATQENITAKGVDTLRQIAVDVVNDGNPKERMLAGKLIGKLDDMMENITPNDVLQGDSATAAEQFSKGRDLWKTYRKSELIDNLLANAKIDAATVNSGGNLQNKIAQAFKPILKDPSLARKFTPEELDAVRKITTGSWTRDTLRIIGRLAPSSNPWFGSMMALIGGGGYAEGGLTGAATSAVVPALGSGAKYLATKATTNAVNNLSRLVRGGAVQAAPTIATPQNAAIARLLMQGTPALSSPYARELARQLAGAGAGASGNPNTGTPGQP